MENNTGTRVGLSHPIPPASSTPQQQGMPDTAPSPTQPPVSFYTAASLYHSYLPASAHVKAVAEGAEEEAARDAARRSFSSSYPVGTKQDGEARWRSVAATDAESPPPRVRRSVPAPSTYDVLVEAPAVEGGKRYPTPPWWRREGDGEDEDTVCIARRGHSQLSRHSLPEQAAAAFSSIPSRAAASASRARNSTHLQRDESPEALTTIADNARGRAAAAPSAPRVAAAAAAAPPPMRSRTRSVVAASRSQTASPSPTHPSIEEDASYISPVDPAAYRGAHSDTHPRDGCVINTQRRRQDETTAAAAATTAYHFYRDASASTAPVTPPTAAAAAAEGPLLSASLTRTAPARLRVYAESTAHPSGFAVPRRGAGDAAPRRLYNGLAVLPSTVADHGAVTRAPSSSVFSATANHPSHYAIQKYREGVAAAIGVDPVRLREGVLHQRYMRVRSGWTEAVGDSTKAGGGGGVRGVAGVPEHHTTTRLRVGLAGGGAVRAAELLDPVSGQARKPNEVSGDYLRRAIRDTQGSRVAPRHEAPCSAAVEPAAHSGADASECDAPTRTIHARGGGAWSRASELRTRATARAALLHTTHTRTGAVMSDGDRRLYWAEHAPLHHSAVRGLNTLLHGVGEAEADYTDDHASSSTLWDTTTSASRRGGSSSCGVDGRHPSDGDVGAAEQERDVAALQPWEGGAVARVRRPQHTDPHDPAVRELQAAVRRRHGAERTLTASAILPDAYRHARRPSAGSREEDLTDYENDVYDAAVTLHPRRHGRDERDAHDATFTSSTQAGDRSGGLVDSYVHHGTAASMVSGGESILPHGVASADAGDDPWGRSGGENGLPDRKGGARAHASAAATAAGVPEKQRGAPAYDAGRARRTALLFPPMLTPLLQEVDECLRFHGMPVMREMWQWGVADQLRLLRSAGFSAAESQTVTWELERMIRATSTMCAVAV